MVRDLHQQVLKESGGLSGEHPDRLYAACARPFQTAFGEELYRSPTLKAAALFHGIITGHVFADGNKRTAAYAALELLRAMDYIPIDPSSLQIRLLGELAIETALRGSLSVDEVAFWLERILGPRG
jgi:death-on-curing protein